ncbi:helix-turn-helix domain-containing protein [Nannocystis punicea]|uniref:Helix-turn-helix transcriptional regulator n=1 Tax=Nannocystis punicea TaxID=2995304 RepID=A0ABY7H9D4_9BACT|nr:helix-turn-helix transcriptional regulator [Nannocystis poenicansa]WAS95877.1 helix-turn-helix transcriptional regulator [Nannocystis poenicansa]
MHDRHVGELLREWRRRCKLSQLDLALQVDISARHLSFVETGRSLPSRTMLLRLADHLRVPLRERNRLLVAAGYAPTFRQRPLEAPDLAAAREAIRQVLRGHEPYPALALDSRWNLVLANDAVEVFLEGVEPALLQPPVNMMRLGLHPGGFASRVENLAQVRAFLLPRLARQALQTGSAELSALHEELVAYGPPGELPPPDLAEVMLPIRLRHRGAVLCFFNTVTTFGAPFDITLEEIVIEAYFPGDARTAEHLRGLAAGVVNTESPGVCPRCGGTAGATSPRPAG